MAEELFKGTVKLKMGEGIAGRVAENRMPIIVDDAQGDQRFSKKADRQRNFTTRNLISVPLVYQEELLGVLSTLNSVGKPCFD
jgi:GAF domain-containing protein